MEKSSKHVKPVFRTAYEAHVWHLNNDPEFIEEMKSLGVYEAHPRAVTDESRKEQEQVMKKWGLKPALSPKEKRPYSLQREDADAVLVRIRRDISKADIGNLWDDIDRMNKSHTGFENRHKVTKHKPPVEDDLLYAIFKQRMYGKTFTQIFEMYSNGILPLYRGKSTTQFKSDDSLERYYQGYRPVT